MTERIVTKQLIDSCRQSIIGKSLIASPNCRRLAYVARVGKKRVVVVDGYEQELYDGIERDSLVFSPDGRRLAYVARAAKKRFVVVDEEERNRYDSVEVQSFVFSPNSQRLAYAAGDKKGWLEWKWDLVVDRRETIHSGALGIGPIAFSPDGHQLAYVAVTPGNYDGTLRMHGQNELEDGKQKYYYDCKGGSLIFSPDGRQLIHVDKKGMGLIVMVDGKVQALKHRALVFSPDSQRFANIRVDTKGEELEYFVVVDGQEVGQYTGSTRFLVFSPDSQRLAFIGSTEGRSFLVLDGKVGRSYKTLSSPVFSPDS